MAETKLAMAERHVREGAGCIARQQALIARLIRDGHGNMLSQADDFLVQFETIQAMFEDHLARYRDEAAEGSR